MRSLPWLLLLVACVEGDATFTGGGLGDEEEVAPGILEVEPTVVRFTDLDPGGFSASTELVLRSKGDNPLYIDSVRLVGNEGEVFVFTTPEKMTMQKDVEKALTIGAAADEEGRFEGRLRIKSNDEEHPQLDVILCATTTGYTGDPTCPGELEGDTGADDSGGVAP
jgi:hypothetical protein